MQVSDLILSDYAAVNDRGKFTLVGAGFTEIITKKLPCIHPLMFVLIRLKVGAEDLGKNRVGIKIIGEKGAIFNAEVNINVAKIESGYKYIPLTNQITNLKFEEEGSYCLEVRVNGDLKRSQDLMIKVATR